MAQALPNGRIATRLHAARGPTSSAGRLRNVMQISLINLASQDARWRAVSRRFLAAGLPPQRQDAVAGAELTAEQCAALYQEDLNARQYHKPLRPGEIGCYASHLQSWRQLLDSGEPAMAIFEDDIEIDADLPQVLDAIGRMPVPWDLIKLIGRDEEKIRERMPLCRGRDLIRYRRVPSLTGAYVISARGAHKMLRRRPPFGRPVDVDIRHWWEYDLSVLGVHPYPVCGAASSRASTIEDRHDDANLAGRFKKLALQARYSVANWAATRAQAPLVPSDGRTVTRPVWASGRDAA
jgi:glycosyl transferase family 25